MTLSVSPYDVYLPKSLKMKTFQIPGSQLRCQCFCSPVCNLMLDWFELESNQFVVYLFTYVMVSSFDTLGPTAVSSIVGDRLSALLVNIDG